jgi:hypothetical protein
VTGLFFDCSVGACTNPVVDPRQPCDECRAIFGDMIRPSDRPAPDIETFVADQAERVRRVGDYLARQRWMAKKEPR